MALPAPSTCAAKVEGDRREIGGATAVGYFRARFLTEGGYVAWVLRLVEIGAEGEGSCADVVEISRPDGLVDIADLGLTLAEAKLVLAGVQREIVAAQARDHAVRRPGCRHCEGVCRVKDFASTRSPRCSAKSRSGCPASAVLAAARPGQAWNGRRTPARLRSWIGCGRRSPPC